MAQKIKKNQVVALIVAAGTGSRFGGRAPKQYTVFSGKTVLEHTVSAFLSHPLVDAVKVVIHKDYAKIYEKNVGHLPLLKPVKGGKSRQDSVRLGLESCDAKQTKYVLIHDAARPFIDKETITRVIKKLASAKAVIPTLSCTDTIKEVTAGKVTRTLKREALVSVQTPQGFHFKDILAAHKKLKGKDLPDDAAVAELSGITVAVVEGSVANQKITTQADRKRLMEYETRIGSGYDVHAFTSGKYVTICGVKVPHTQGLEGHSDADVGLHALVDALLGAVGENDIGFHFPPSDKKWKGADSKTFVEHAAKLVAKKSGSIVNVDITIIGESPRVSPYRDAMRNRVAKLLKLPTSRVNVKATTTEKLGFLGRREGLAAEAVVAVKLPVNED
ncbi:MAG: bifunctional 2-C-methyl-D-erythritol 4-phosphate cytidylyltransferase/2-C-methyl-D-erythritol 2,4-cyclodiphosphate synthase [Proteobacteria bacterium]|nr:bifunctional 2-C-methyl-D-erythritol 4-phosphate cytidylyltransferase/2-C-methyl-D-erythritol 2,4-cyclodiphosphate synthase [Pseudomonadota bacterium]